MARTWTKQEVSPEDILGGARNLDRRRPVWTMDVCPSWIEAEVYLSWARTALGTANPFGYDAAVCYAKRAVCRLIDSLMHYNHLKTWVRAKYPLKIELLEKVGIDIKSVIRELVINNRNDIEHNYSAATERQARHAVELAEMALPPLAAEASGWATVTLGLNYGGNIGGPDPAAKGGYSFWNYDFDAHLPFLLVDYADVTPRVMIIRRNIEEVTFAPLKNFHKDQAVDLAKQLREQKVAGTMHTGCNGPRLVEELKSHLELAF
jgi:hypothetical protein